ncbi:MAG: Ig-like domain-containing protein [Turneriella sp.]|nr:Ig-like domain-containing protein [Turneriella sp.]
MVSAVQKKRHWSRRIQSRPLLLIFAFLLACQAKPSLDVQLSLKDLIPPKVVSVIPENGATEVSDRPTVVIQFNEPMDAATLNSSNVFIQTIHGNKAMGRYEYSEATNVLEIHIQQKLYLATTYYVRISDKVRDRAGNAIGLYETTFTTDQCPKARSGSKIHFNGTISAMAKVGCTLYVGGSFTHVSTATPHGMAIDLNTAVVSSSFQYEDINDYVRVAIPDGEGGWYIGGDFTQIGDKKRMHLARLSHAGEILSWAPEANGTIYALRKKGDTIYVGGSFTAINGNPRNYIAAVDIRGNLLPWNPEVDGVVRAIDTAQNAIYFGGDFDRVNGVFRDKAAAVSEQGTLLPWNPGFNDTVTAVAASGNTVVWGGNFSVPRNRLAAFDSNGNLLGWNPHPDGEIAELIAVGNTLFAMGGFTTLNSGATTRNYVAAISIDASCLSSYTMSCILNWNPHVDGYVQAASFQNDVLYIGGQFENINVQARTRLAAIKADASCLSTYSAATCLLPFNPRAQAGVLALGVSNGLIYAGGIFTGFGDPLPRNYLAAVSTDGNLLSWAPSADLSVFSLAEANGVIYAGGQFNNVNGSSRSKVAAIDLAGNVTGWNPGANAKVNAIAVRDNIVYLGGDFTQVAATARNYLAAVTTSGAGTLKNWNPNVGGVIQDFIIKGEVLYVGGGFTTVGGSTRNRLAAISISSNSLNCLDSYSTPMCLLNWQPNPNAIVNAVTIQDDMLYAGGGFSSLDSLGRDRLAAIRLTTTCLTAYSSSCIADWQPSADGTVLSIVSGNNQIFLGGAFTNVNGMERRYLAAVDLQGQLASFNTSANSMVYKLLYSGKTIYAAGDFTAVGGEAAYRVSSINSDGTVNW